MKRLTIVFLLIYFLAGCQAVRENGISRNWLEGLKLFRAKNIDEASKLAEMQAKLDQSQTQMKIEIDNNKTELKQKESMNRLKLFCIGAIILAAFAVGIGIWLKHKTIIILSGVTMLASITGFGLAAAEQRYAAILAFGGLIIAGMLVVFAVFMIFKVIYEVVKSIEKAKFLNSSIKDTLKEIDGVQSPLTEKVVEKFQNL